MIKKRIEEVFNEEITDAADYTNATKEDVKYAIGIHNESNNAHMEILKKKAEFVSITIPAGRMSGDADGDGKFTENDLDIIVKCMGNSSEVTDEMQRRCCDVNRDNIVNFLDMNCINGLISGVKAGTYCRDLLNNWQWNENYQTEDGQFYMDIAIEGMTSSSSAIVAIDTEAYARDYYAECLDGKLRIYARLCPINELTAVVAWGEGDGTAAVTFTCEKPNTEFNMIKIPAARMLGDVNGDGKIDEKDIALISGYVASAGTSITDETQLKCADVDGSGAVTANDTNAITAYIAGNRKLVDFSYDIFDIWDVRKPLGHSEEYYYIDIKIEGINTQMSAHIAIKGKSEKNNFLAECHNGFIRIYAKFPPISELDAIVVWGKGNRTAICSIEETEDVVNESNCKMLIFNDIEITEEMWTKSRGISGYSYRASLSGDDFPEIDNKCYADVVFDVTNQSALTNLAPVCRTNINGSLDIFAKSPTAVMIDTIAVYKVV